VVAVIENGFVSSNGKDVVSNIINTSIAINRNQMKPQKNSGAKKSKRGSNAGDKNNRFIENFMSDLKDEGGVCPDGVYVARVISRLGNGRMTVFYIDEDNQPKIVQAILRGILRAKGRKDVWIDPGAIIIITASGFGGSAEYSIMSVLSDSDVAQLRVGTDFDARIFDINVIDPKELVTNKPIADIVFTEDVDVDKV